MPYPWEKSKDISTLVSYVQSSLDALEKYALECETKANEQEERANQLESQVGDLQAEIAGLEKNVQTLTAASI